MLHDLIARGGAVALIALVPAAHPHHARHHHTPPRRVHAAPVWTPIPPASECERVVGDAILPC